MHRPPQQLWANPHSNRPGGIQRPSDLVHAVVIGGDVDNEAARTVRLDLAELPRSVGQRIGDHDHLAVGEADEPVGVGGLRVRLSFPPDLPGQSLVDCPNRTVLFHDSSPRGNLPPYSTVPPAPGAAPAASPVTCRTRCSGRSGCPAAGWRSTTRPRRTSGRRRPLCGKGSRKAVDRRKRLPTSRRLFLPLFLPRGLTSGRTSRCGGVKLL